MLLVAGSANLDFVVRAKHIPAPGETVLGRQFQTFPGGKGANQAVACARAGGAATAMLCALGDDDFAKPLLASLATANVQLHTVRSPQPTGTAFVCVSDEGENAITVVPGANADLQPTHWPAHLHISHVLMQLETPVATVLAFAKAARAQGTKVLLNAAPARELPAELLRNIDMLIVNEGELAALAGIDPDKKAGKKDDVLAQLEHLAKLHHLHDVIVTLGAQGCLALHQGHVLHQKAYQVEVVDTTAAGDTFCGTLAAALARGAPIQQCLQEASAASALACTKLGAQSSIPSREEVIALMKNAL